jgi:hypothetical protein
METNQQTDTTAEIGAALLVDGGKVTLRIVREDDVKDGLYLARCHVAKGWQHAGANPNAIESL